MENFKCSLCGKELTDLSIKITLNVDVDRKRVDDVWEIIPNMSEVQFRENLCIDCFNLFADKLGELNQHVIKFNSVPESFDLINKESDNV